MVRFRFWRAASTAPDLPHPRLIPLPGTPTLVHVLTKGWSVLLGTQRHDVVASWDIHGTGGGMILVDGVVRQRWLIGAKWPGVKKQFRLGLFDACLVQQGFSGYRLEVGGAISEHGTLPPTNEAVRWNRLGLLVLLGPVLIVLVGLIVVLVWTRG